MSYRARTLWIILYLLVLAHQAVLLWLGFAFLVRVLRDAPDASTWPLWAIFIPLTAFSMLVCSMAADGMMKRLEKRKVRP